MSVTSLRLSRAARTQSSIFVALVLWLSGCRAPANGMTEAKGACQDAAPPVTAAERIDVPPPGRLYHGVFTAGDTGTGEEDDMTATDVARYEHAVSRSVAWVYFSHNWYRDRSFPLDTVRWIAAAGHVPYIRLMLRSSPEEYHREKTFSLQRIIDGEFDDDLCRWSQAARDFGGPLLAEFGTEVNGDWFPWNGRWNGGGRTDRYGDDDTPDGPERFRDAWRHIHDLADRQGANNITWVFHVDDEDSPDESWNRFEQYYPGDAWVDWVGVSVYGALTPQDTEWRTFREGMDAAYDRLTALTDRPVVVLEFGTTANHPDVPQAAWADAALADILGGRWPRLIGFSWWNEHWPNDDDPAHDSELRVEKNPDLQRILRAALSEATRVVDKPLIRLRPPR